jgi:hypothetical protein
MQLTPRPRLDAKKDTSRLIPRLVSLLGIVMSFEADFGENGASGFGGQGLAWSQKKERKWRQWVASLRRFRHNLGIRWSDGSGETVAR